MRISIVTKELEDIDLQATDVSVMPTTVNLWNATFDEEKSCRSDYDVFRSKFCEEASFCRGQSPSLKGEYYLSIPYKYVDSIFVFDSAL